MTFRERGGRGRGRGGRGGGMTNASQEDPKGVDGALEVVGVGREGLVEGALEGNLTPEVQYMGHIAYSVVAPVIISFGILTNVLNLVVLTRPSLRGPTFRYLKWLAVANLLVCVVLLPFTLHSHANPVPYAAALYFAHVEVPVGNALIASSVYIVVGLSIDRFVAVCYPRKYRNLHSHYVASVRIALSFVIAFIMYVPMAFYKVVVPAGASADRFLIEENPRMVSTGWFKVYEYLLEICVRFAPAVLLAVLNTWIIVEFKRVSRRRLLLSQGVSCEVSAVPSQSCLEGSANDGDGDGADPRAAEGEAGGARSSPSRSAGEQEAVGLSTISVSAPSSAPPRGMSERRHDMERRLVLLLVSIIVAFFVTNIPAAVLSLTFRDDKRNDLNFQIFRAVANNLEFLNFGLNFVLYFLFSKDIRSAFVSLLRRSLDRLREGVEGSNSKYAATSL